MEQLLGEIAAELEQIASALGPSAIEWITLSIASITLVLLLFYTYYTRKIALTTEKTLSESLRPNIFWELISGVNFYKQVELEQNPTWIHDTRCRVQNLSMHNISVIVNLNLTIDGNPEIINELYSGQKAWTLGPRQGIIGHFNLANKFNLDNIQEIEIDLEISYTSESGEWYFIPKQKWHYDKSRHVWRNDIGVVV